MNIIQGYVIQVKRIPLVLSPALPHLAVAG